MDAPTTMKTVDLDQLMDDILALFPAETIPRSMVPQVMKIARDMAVVAGVVGALQATAGRVFAETAKGNTAAAEAFFEVLTSIRVDLRGNDPYKVAMK